MRHWRQRSSRGVGDERGSRLETVATGASEGDVDSTMRATMLERQVMKRRVRLWWTEEGKGSGKQGKQRPRRKQLIAEGLVGHDYREMAIAEQRWQATGNEGVGDTVGKWRGLTAMAGTMAAEEGRKRAARWYDGGSTGVVVTIEEVAAWLGNRKQWRWGKKMKKLREVAVVG
ncbi:hypothetical protein BHM03_00047955 [Ensete ventricosum]|nr:hypothetical protein BHM03_00047955 [Ensete ventricosum]